MSGGGLPPTLHCTLRESFSITSRSRREVRKRGVSAWSSGSITPLVECVVLVDLSQLFYEKKIFYGKIKKQVM